MRRSRIVCGWLLLLLLAEARLCTAQSGTASLQADAPYRLKVAVDEVILNFHAQDVHGLPVNDLKLSELSLYDNEKKQSGILSFQMLQNLPLRAGVLVDTSESMEQDRDGSREVAVRYAQRLLAQRADRAFVMKFGVLSEVTETWTEQPSALVAGIRRSVGYSESSVHGTALLDAVYGACLNLFSHIDYAASGNFVLLFSDGEDNASHASVRQAVDMCQHSGTAIYAVHTEREANLSPSGLRTLEELAAESGGRVFVDGGEADSESVLRMIEADRRNQYRLIYRPMGLRHDGAFHRIALLVPERVSSVSVRSGYYAPAR